MSILKDFEWKSKYSPNDGNLLNLFYIPVLSCAVRYDRTTGFFSADALAKAAVGVEELVRNKGHMRLIVGCTLDYDEVCAINRGESLRKTVEANLQRCPFDANSNEVHDSLELLAWMVANEYLDVRVAVPLNQELGTPAPNDTLFHEKSALIPGCIYNYNRLPKKRCVALIARSARVKMIIRAPSMGPKRLPLLLH
ncbi:MAG: hypothetical protein K6G15_06855, partial [Desulfovibrio sp.]|nr:hypothetical protein [Desulfovibrio sp.]